MNVFSQLHRNGVEYIWISLGCPQILFGYRWYRSDIARYRLDIDKCSLDCSVFHRIHGICRVYYFHGIHGVHRSILYPSLSIESMECVHGIHRSIESMESVGSMESKHSVEFVESTQARNSIHCTDPMESMRFCGCGFHGCNDLCAIDFSQTKALACRGVLTLVV